MIIGFFLQTVLCQIYLRKIINSSSIDKAVVNYGVSKPKSQIENDLIKTEREILECVWFRDNDVRLAGDDNRDDTADFKEEKSCRPI